MSRPVTPGRRRRPTRRWRQACGRRGRRGQRGSVTVEMAVALPAVVLVLSVVLLLAAAASLQMRCTDAARAGAREAALGEGHEQVAAVARRVAGGGADVTVDLDPPWVKVTVSAPVAAGWLGPAALRARASALARVEP